MARGLVPIVLEMGMKANYSWLNGFVCTQESLLICLKLACQWIVVNTLQCLLMQLIRYTITLILIYGLMHLQMEWLEQ